MSANLLGELDSFYGKSNEPNNEQETGSFQRHASFFSRPGSLSFPNQHTANLDEEDDFGDFETGGSSQPSEAPLRSVGFKYHPTSVQYDTATPSFRNGKPRDENVLFDVEDEEEQDDFGDFEGFEQGARPTSLHQNATPQIDSTATLIDLDEQQEFNPENSRSISLGDSVPQKILKGPNATTLHQPEASTSPAFDNPWDDFEDSKPVNQPPKSKTFDDNAGKEARHIQASSETVHTEEAVASGLMLGALLNTKFITSSNKVPTNIPPPALVLTLFGPLFTQIQDQLLVPIAKLSGPHRESILHQADVIECLRSILTIATVLGHVVAGRKHRWKRDTILAQSMRIGPASSSGKSGGMKLTGVDRTESAREDREASDAVRAWRGIVGRIRTAITAAGNLGAVPDVTDNLVVRTAQRGEGAVTSPKQCCLCGIKRNERVHKVDFEVHDSFGEWWLEHWGHVDCMKFWESHKDLLKTR